MRHYCTLFDVNYMAKGLALHESLVNHSSEPFMLHILAMDMETFWLLTEMQLVNVEVIPLESFEHALKMQPVKASRSWQEYCWTCASSLMEYLLSQFDGVTYLDADIFFYSDPKVIYEEIQDKSIGITPHRFNAREERRLGINGKFNVGLVYSANTEVGRKCIRRWGSQCREWCFNKNESGRFGDQAYLDSWQTDYLGEVCIIQNLGVNLGPWSVGNFEVNRYLDIATMQNHVLVIDDKRADRLVCYHMHEFKDPLRLTGWRLRESDVQLIYHPYVSAFIEAQERIKIASARLKMRQEIAARESVNA